jgi:hypothetical protein
MNIKLLKSVQAYSAATTEGEKKRGEHADALFAAGMRHTACISPAGKDSAESTATEDEFAKTKAAILAGFSQSDTALFLVDVKALSDEDKARKRYVTQQISSRLKDLRNQLKARAIAAGEIEPEQKEIKTSVEKIIVALKTIANIARKDETPEYDPAQLIKSVAHTMSLIGSDEDLRAIIEG